jgi:hypothetical protein
MRGEDPRIHLKKEALSKMMDRRVKPGDDVSRKIRQFSINLFRIDRSKQTIDQGLRDALIGHRLE